MTCLQNAKFVLAISDGCSVFEICIKMKLCFHNFRSIKKRGYFKKVYYLQNLRENLFYNQWQLSES